MIFSHTPYTRLVILSSYLGVGSGAERGRPARDSQGGMLDGVLQNPPSQRVLARGVMGGVTLARRRRLLVHPVALNCGCLCCLHCAYPELDRSSTAASGATPVRAWPRQLHVARTMSLDTPTVSVARF